MLTTLQEFQIDDVNDINLVGLNAFRILERLKGVESQRLVIFICVEDVELNPFKGDTCAGG